MWLVDLHQYAPARARDSDSGPVDQKVHGLKIFDPETVLRLMDKILHDLKDPKLWELWYIPYYGSCRILSINRIMRVSPACTKNRETIEVHLALGKQHPPDFAYKS